MGKVTKMSNAAAVLAELYPKAVKSKRELDELLEQFELGKDRSVSIQQRLGALTADFSRLVKRLEENFEEVEKTDKSQKDSWQRRINKLAADAESFRLSLDKQLGHVYRAQIQQEERRKLFDGSKKRDATDHMLDERQRLQESHSVLDSMLAQGRGVIDMMGAQNKTLKNAKRKALDIASSVGLSSSLLGVIERRNSLDKWLVFGLMCVTVFIFWAVWKLVIG
eukprot:GDKI01029830.1.p1 GENE.GDKI01029830.1~~GDKI01029830.1.p1  ORF type:complete len:223 (-),score=42.42 GDKI01029830.1:21-689(-)